MEVDTPEAGATVSEAGPAPVDASTGELLDAFQSTYQRIGRTADKAREAATFAFALADVLVRRGVIGVDELEASRRKVDERLSGELKESGLTINLLENDVDKYSVTAVEDIDCGARIDRCKAACCRLRFALSEQDIAERVVHWSLSEPYLNRQGPDGWCVHSDADGRCNVYSQRPLVCRTYDCRKDERIWEDFEGGVVNPDLAALLAELEAVPVAAPRLRR